jgi:tetratricopeptide (TPR) repeat protein
VAAANRAALGFLDFSLGDNEAAVRWFSPMSGRFLRGEAGDPGLRHNVLLPDAIEALIALGRLEEAEELLVVWDHLGERFDRPRMHATAARCRALLAAAAGELDVAIEHAEAALEHHRDLPVPFEHARSLIVIGTLHRRGKHKAARVYAKLGIRSRTELAATRPASDGRSRSPAPPPASRS